MKKIVAIIGAVAMAGIASADLSVSFVNSGVGVQDGLGAFKEEGSLVQLVWSMTGIQTSGGGSFDTLNGAPLSGEYILIDDATINGFGFWGPTSGLWSDADVGGNNINGGYFFTRIFQANGASGESFLDVNQVDSSLYVYNPQDTATTYSANATGATPGSTIFTNENGSSVIPEPATVGLMGMAGLGMFLARKKAHS